MIAAAWLNRAGLVLGAVGVILIFIWGPPQPDLTEGVGMELEDLTPLPVGEPFHGRTVAEYNLSVRRKRGRHTILSRVGLALIGFGFAAQFVATYY